MTTLTDKELIKEIKERIGSLDVRDNIERRAYEIALASLEADPVAYIFKHPAGKLFWALTDESNKEQADVIPVYAAPPVPVVPAALPENDDEDGHDIDYLEPSEVYSLGRTAGWNACRAAMLHGVEPVSQTYKLPPLSSNEVNDAAWKLHNMLTEHGPLNGRQFNNLKGCFYEALKVAMRNYPDIPDSSAQAPGKGGFPGERIRIKPHVYRELVNRLHDTAIKCAGTQQLRERISRVLGEVITPDRHKQAEKSGLERSHLEAALNIKPGHTLGVIDAMLVHEMAKALLPLEAD
ncbi:TPA: hypothetical protein P1L88_004088 [Escherichia coli]|nr:hypothetical protein [Escherichia coli]